MWHRLKLVTRQFWRIHYFCILSYAIVLGYFCIFCHWHQFSQTKQSLLYMKTKATCYWTNRNHRRQGFYNSTVDKSQPCHQWLNAERVRRLILSARIQSNTPSRVDGWWRMTSTADCRGRASHQGQVSNARFSL